MARHPVLSLLVLSTVLLAACTTGSPADHPGSRGPSYSPAWTERTLPAPPGPAGRVAVRDAVRCGARWYVVGGVFLAEPTADQDSRPAAWTSTDGTSWTVVPAEPTTYWGERAVLASAACSEGRLAVVGAKSGGAHGNPRVTTWFLGDDGVLHDVVAAFSQYGGDKATNVGPVTGGAGGFLIAGNRTSGPAVWFSADAREFTKVEGAPALADDEHRALAQAAAWDGTGWTLVGGVSTPGDLDREPAAWTSADGTTWERQEVPGSRGFDDLQRVVARGGELVAAGLRGEEFATWLRVDGRWQHGSGFGALDDDAPAAPFVASLALGGGRVWATVSDGERYQLWTSHDARDWRRLETPAEPRTAGEQVLAVAADEDSVVLLADDGEAGRVWTSP